MNRCTTIHNHVKCIKGYTGAASNDMKFLIHFYLKHKNGPHTAGKYAAVYILPQRAVNEYILLSMLSIL